MADESKKSLLEFPCDFPIKIMGKRTDNFSQTVVAIVLKHAPDFAVETVELRASESANYVSVTCTIRAQSREQLDALYRELTSHPSVKFVL
jgi:putative lipoic acid-binding regulatory protein